MYVNRKYYEEESYEYLEDEYGIEELANAEFELIEENTIDDIRLFETKGCEDTAERDLRSYINNTIVPYLKYLDKEIQELKEK